MEPHVHTREAWCVHKCAARAVVPVAFKQTNKQTAGVGRKPKENDWHLRMVHGACWVCVEREGEGESESESENKRTREKETKKEKGGRTVHIY